MITRVRIEGHSHDRNVLAGQIEWLAQQIEQAFGNLASGFQVSNSGGVISGGSKQGHPIPVGRGHELYERKDDNPGTWEGRLILYVDSSSQGDWSTYLNAIGEADSDV